MVALAKSSVQTLHHLQFPNESNAYRRARILPEGRGDFEPQLNYA